MSIKLDALSRRFGSHVAVDQVSIEIETGKLLALVGPSGSGKSTLLELISGDLIVDSGVVYIDGQRVADRQSPQVQQIDDRSRIRYSGTMRLLGNLARDRQHSEKRQERQSLGEQQLAALSDLVADLPNVVLLDDPLSGVDPVLRAKALAVFHKARQERPITAIWVTHDLHQTLCLADEVAIMLAGRISQTGTAETLYQRPLNEAVARFVGAGSYLIAHSLGPASSLLDGRCRVISPDFEAEVSCRNDSQAGDVMVLFRPDDVVLTTHEAMSNCSRGVVSSCTFNGERYDVMIEMPSGNSLMLREEQRLDVNQPVVIQVRGGWVLPE